MIDDAQLVARGKAIFNSGKYTPGAAPPPPPVSAPPTLLDLEEDFWQQPVLADIYSASMARMCSPWGLFGALMCRAISYVPSSVAFPPTILSKLSLNCAVALVSRSGGGKTGLMGVAEELLPNTIGTPVSGLGSTQGVADAYWGEWVEETKTRERIYSVMFVDDEIENVAANGRTSSGSSLIPTVRKLVSGSPLASGYKKTNSTKPLAAHDYRATVLLGVQPAMSHTLFSRVGDGTPQRFFWAETLDTRNTRASRSAAVMPAPFTLPDYYPNTEIVLTEQIENAIIEFREQQALGQVSDLDGQAITIKLKTAYCIAVLRGRTVMTDEDWRLAIAMRVSDFYRSACEAALAEASRKEDEKNGARIANRKAGADKRSREIVVERAAEYQKEWQEIADRIIKKLVENNGRMSREAQLRLFDTRTARYKIAQQVREDLIKLKAIRREPPDPVEIPNKRYAWVLEDASRARYELLTEEEER